MPRISELPAETTPSDDDPLAIVDNSGAITKKITREDLLKGSPLPAGTVDNQALADEVVDPRTVDWDSFAPTFARATSTFTTAGNTNHQQVTGLSVTIDIVSGGIYSLEAFGDALGTNTNPATVAFSIWDGTVGSGTRLAASEVTTRAGGARDNAFVKTITSSLSAGSHTFNVGLRTDNASNTAFILASSTEPMFLSVQRVG